MKEKLILIACILLSIIGCKKEPGKLSGVVTYFFNKNFGDKPDVGANIYILNSNDIDSNSIKHLAEIGVISTFYYGVEDFKRSMKSDSIEVATSPYADIRDMYKQSMEQDKSLIETYQSSLDRYNIKSEDDFNRFDQSAHDELESFKNNKQVSTFVVDGNGNFSTMLPPGKYWVLIESNHREGQSKTELLHQIHLKSVEVVTEKEKTVNANFGM
jgi:hypothetical protein